jgi:cell division transport system ATP-binding protein
MRNNQKITGIKNHFLRRIVVINFENVTKIYQNGTLALSKINLKINKGDFAFFIGQSGSGKSTMIKLILREEEVTEGTVSVNGFNVTTMGRKDIPFFRRSVGMVFQDFRLLPGKTVYENVAFAMQVVEALPKEIRRRVPMVLGLVGLSNKAKAYPNQLSGGEQQRVALARALVNNPVLLVADEPTGNLDPETSWDIMKLLSEVNQMGTTVVVATHEKNIVDSMKKRVIALSKGEIIRDQEKGQYEDEDTNHKIYN